MLSQKCYLDTSHSLDTDFNFRQKGEPGLYNQDLNTVSTILIRYHAGLHVSNTLFQIKNTDINLTDGKSQKLRIVCMRHQVQQVQIIESTDASFMAMNRND